MPGATGTSFRPSVAVEGRLPEAAAAVRPMTRGGRDALLAHLLRRQLQRVLWLADLEVCGERVEPKAFALSPRAPQGATAATPPRVRYESPQSYLRMEPRLEVIERGLRRALRFGHFLGDAAPLPVDGFRLRDLANWAGYPSTLATNVGSLSSYCNCDCEFCFEKDARGSGMSLGQGLLSLQEVETRRRYYSPGTQTGLLPAQRAYLEPFTNPHCLDILERVHASAPDETIVLTTNGSALTEDVVARLARLRPIILGLSLNAATVEARLRTMRDRTRAAAETAIASPALLRRYEVPFVGSYVPWPSKPLSDMEETVRLIDRNDGILARICMPSWTRWGRKHPPFRHAEYWEEILQVAERLRGEVGVPVHITPGMCQLQTMRPVIQGAVKYSPAAEAGLRYGDVILAIDGERVLTRPEVLGVLDLRARDPSITRTRFTVQRQADTLDIDVPHVEDRDGLRYPLCSLAETAGPCEGVRFLGLFLPDGLQLRSFMRLKDIVEEYPGKPILFYISPLAGPHFLEGMGTLGQAAAFIDSADVYVETLWPTYWGGNIVVGDLWTNGDVIARTRQWMARTGLKPEVILIPETYLSHSGRDLLGRPYLEVERELDIEVRLLRCNRINI